MTEIYLATEDTLSEAVAERLVINANQSLQVSVRMGGKGNGYLKQKLPKLIELANSIPVFLLTDLDRLECPPALINEWSGGRSMPPTMLFRIAVREVESWLLADRNAFADFIGVSPNKIPLSPESIDDPKQVLLGLVRRYGNRAIKSEILPAPNSRSSVGLGYNQTLGRFVMDKWEPRRAVENSDSLARAYARLHEL